MNRYHILSIVCFFIGIVFFVLGFFTGDVKAGFIVIIPFIAGSGIYALLGFIIIFISILLFMFGFNRPVNSEEFSYDDGSGKKSSFKTGGVILIGPIPIVFGSNWKIALAMMIAGFLIMIFLLFLLK